MTLVPTDVLARCLYLYENDSLALNPVESRSLYVYENDGMQPLSIEARALYAYENDGIQHLVILHRCLYDYEALRDLAVFPWLDHIDPVQQWPGGQVSLFGDGLGQFVEAGSVSSVTGSSTVGLNIPENVTHRTSDYWQSNDGATAWLRFTFGGATTLYGIALEDLVDAFANKWGVPLFRFSDGGPDVVATDPVPIPVGGDRTAEYPVGVVRDLFVFPAERTVTWVEVRISSGGSGTSRGLSQAWVYADEGKNAEPSTVTLNGETSGTSGPWLNRSPGLWPANAGLPMEPAATMTVPMDGESGLVKVSEP